MYKTTLQKNARLAPRSIVQGMPRWRSTGCVSQSPQSNLGTNIQPDCVMRVMALFGVCAVKKKWAGEASWELDKFAHSLFVRRLFLGLHIYQIQSSPPFVSLFTPPPGIDGTGRCESERLKQLQNETQFDSIAKDGMCNK